MASITFDSVTAYFLLRKRRPILRDFNLQISHQSITGIYGPNAVGKSTLLRIAANLRRGIYLTKQSRILYNSKPDRPYIAFVPQDYAATILPWYASTLILRCPLSHPVL